MGVTQPFMYDKPSSYNFGSPTNRPFNPKAVTHASYTPPPQRIKHDGPLVNFNRHPDSYIQAPYGQVNAVPMNPKTKGRVKFAWKTQRILRLLALLGSIGAVFCIIAIRKTSGSVGWIIRVGPAVALVHTLYGLYFLCRAVNARPPASCASYQMFAALLDTGLIPFFAFSGYMAWADYTSNAYGWGTLFDQNDLDYKVIRSFFIVCAVEIALFLTSLVLDIYLAIMYRKIVRLPPDMNPLENKDNLTKRPHHKRNKSELLHEKHMSNSTLASQRFSQQSQADVSSRRIPFTHTRTDSADREIPMSFSREMLNDLQNSYAGRASTSSDHDHAQLSRPGSAVMPPVNSRAAGAGLDHKPARSSNLATSTKERPLSWLSYSNYEGMPAELSDYAEQQLDNDIRAMSPVSAISDNENRPPGVPAKELYDPRIRREQEVDSRKVSGISEHDFSFVEDTSPSMPPAYGSVAKRSLEPLGMNPPTPVNQHFQDKELMVRPLSFASHGTPPRSTLRETDNNLVASATPTSRPASFVGSGTKSRFYGNLRSSVGGSPVRASRDDFDDLGRSNTVRSDESGNFEVYDSDSDDGRHPSNVQHGEPIEIIDFAADREWNGQRQISNSTGYDLHSGYAGLDPEFGRGMARRREVSGKAAEEGRSYVITSNASSPMPVQTRPGAAGWARFGGL